MGMTYERARAALSFGAEVPHCRVLGLMLMASEEFRRRRGQVDCVCCGALVYVHGPGMTEQRIVDLTSEHTCHVLRAMADDEGISIGVDSDAIEDAEMLLAKWDSATIPNRHDVLAEQCERISDRAGA